MYPNSVRKKFFALIIAASRMGFPIIPFTPGVVWGQNTLAFQAKESELCNACILGAFALLKLA
jgi:hypothetical protein